MIQKKKSQSTKNFQSQYKFYKERKEHGEKEHEKPNLNKPIYFLGEEFKCTKEDFELYLD